VIAAIDISKSMFCDDIYPNRFKFAKEKFFESLNYLKDARVALIGFSSRTFLISPLSEDFNSLKFLAKNLNTDYLTLKGTDFLALLHSANDLFIEKKYKNLLIFTDGGDKKDFSKEIEFAKEHNIRVFIYNIATKKGGVIKDQNGVVKDKEGNIVIVKRNEKIKALALKSGGAYMNYSLKRGDIKSLIDEMRRGIKEKERVKKSIKDKKELFYYPLWLMVLTLFMALFSLPRRRGV
jgi:Ca-activated chloride channel family protein